MEAAIELVERVSNVLYILLALASLRSWYRHRDAASAWLAGTFASLGLIVAAGLIAGDEPPALVTLISVTVLAAFPYLLLRFSAALEPLGRRTALAALLATVVVVAYGLVISATEGFPGPDEPQTTTVAIFTLVFVVQWFGILGLVAVRLWRAGRGQPAIARRRMRLMAVAAVVIVIALAIAATGSAEPMVRLTGQLFGIGSAVLFYLGFATPSLLRAAWRVEAEDELYRAAVALMRARSPDEVGDVMVPHLARVIGARGVVLRSEGGAVARHGDVDGPPTRSHALLRATVEIWGSPYAPFFGDDEDRLLGRLGLLTDLALDRTTLLQSEQQARRQVEATNEELEAFVYSASHDLKTPLIAFLGYLDLLEIDHGDRLTGELRTYVDRMRSNGLHMQALIDDLLALSRVGRVDTEPEAVDLAACFDEVARDLVATYPDARVIVDDLPPVWLNPTRARQLATNAVTNAFKHSGRPDVTVSVEVVGVENGLVELRVLDDGVGIPADQLERVTRVFERLEGGHGAGTGIGLAIARKICVDAGGDLRFVPHTGGADLRLSLRSTSDQPTRSRGLGGDPTRPTLDPQGV